MLREATANSVARKQHAAPKCFAIGITRMECPFSGSKDRGRRSFDSPLGRLCLFWSQFCLNQRRGWLPASLIGDSIIPSESEMYWHSKFGLIGASCKKIDEFSPVRR